MSYIKHAYEAGKTAAFAKFAWSVPDVVRRPLMSAAFGAVPGAAIGALHPGDGDSRLTGALKGGVGGAVGAGLAGAALQPHVLAEHLILGMGPGVLGGLAGRSV